MKIKLWQIIYGVAILAIDGLCLAVKVNINNYLWILAGILAFLVFVSYDVFSSGEQHRANFYFDRANGTKDNKEKVMSIGRFIIMVIPIALALGLNYLLGV